jgi:hypothetical protein
MIMKNNDCLSEQDLILHYYNELLVNSEQSRHLSACQLCAKRFSKLSSALSKLPALESESDPSAGVRMAARVSERLKSRSMSWLPALRFSAIAVIVLVAAFSLWNPLTEFQQLALHAPLPSAAMTLDEEMPDIDFLNDLELLQELELLSQIEGV